MSRHPGHLQRVLLRTPLHPQKVTLHSNCYLVEANNCICHSKDQVDVLLREFLSHQAQRGIVLGKRRGHTLAMCAPRHLGAHHALQQGLGLFSYPIGALHRSSEQPNPVHGLGFTSVVEAE